MIIQPDTSDARHLYSLMISVIVPRPIALVSTLSPDGVRNVAPFSFFVGLGASPPMMGFCPGLRKGQEKDTLRNIRINRCCVINTVDEALAEQMNLTAAEFPPEIDECDVAGLETVPGDIVNAPRLIAAPVSMECVLDQIVEIKGGVSHFVIVEALRFHVRDDIMVDGLVDIRKYRPVGRLGGSDYARINNIFSMPRMDWEAVLAAHQKKDKE